MSNPYDPPTPPSDEGQDQPSDQPPSAPMYGQTPYPAGAPDSPYGTGGTPPVGGQSKGLAIAALVLAITVCLFPVSVVLAIVVLAKGMAGRGLAIAALVINVVVALALVVVVVLAFASVDSVRDLEVGQCLNGEGLSAGDEPVSGIDVVACDTPHQGEVLAVVDLDGAQAESFGDEVANTLCVETIAFTQEEFDLFVDNDWNYLGVTPDRDPAAGDPLVCVAFAADGSDIDAGIR